MSLFNQPSAWAAQVIGTKVRFWIATTVAIMFYVITAAMILAGEARASLGTLLFLCLMQIQFLYALHRVHAKLVSKVPRQPSAASSAA